MKAFADPGHRNMYYGDQVIEMVARLAENDTEFGILLKHLEEIDCEKSGFHEGDLEKIDELSKCLRETPWNRCFVDTLLHGESQRILDLAEQVAFLRKHRVDFDVPDFGKHPSPSWVERYPDLFANALRQLDSLTANGEKLARKWLESLHFDPEEIRKEIEFLQQRLDCFPDLPARPRIEKRIENLSLRLECKTPPRLSEARLKRLEAKLRERVRRAFFDRLRQTVRSCFERTVRRELEIDSYPDTWHDPLHRKIVLGILGLNAEKVKSLAGRLLRSLCGAVEWDFRNESANRLFLQKMHEQGIDTAPWTEASEAERHVSSKKNERIRGLADRESGLRFLLP